ncbi:MAG: alpha/beta fold hydrolase [Actinomycetota bacterium]
MAIATVDGRTIAYVRQGEGPPLVLLHGGLSDAREWRFQVPVLARSYDTVAWDAPGCGGSDDPPETFRMPEYADALVSVLDALDVGQVHLVGLSWGSTLAIEAVRRHPDRVASMVLASAYAGWKGSLAPEEVERRLTAALADLALPPERLARSFAPTLFTSDAPMSLVDETVSMMAEYHPGGVEPMLRAMAEADLRDALGEILVPVLLLYGEEDVRSPREIAEALADSISGSQLRFLPGVRHQSNLEAPDAFNDAVLGFLAKV